MEPYHKALAKQLAKLPEYLQQDPALEPFLKQVSNYYNSYERDKKLSEHAFEVSEREYQEAVSDLKKQYELKDQSTYKIKQIIQSLDPSIQNVDEIKDIDIISVLDLLESHIKRSKMLEEALIKAKEAAEASVVAKSNFLSVMSHEIRTPLNAIIGSIHILKEEEHLKEQEKYINSLDISADNLLNLVNDILDFSKIEEGKINFVEQNINIKELTQNIKQSNYFKANEGQNKIKVMLDDTIPDFIIGDETRLSQILNNLVSNAIKFTKKGLITMSVQVKDIGPQKTELEFSVSDTGIGIEKKKLDTIFERFTQADSAITRQYGGSGLGLTIVKKLLQLQGSDIQVESEPGKGSRFFFNLSFKNSRKQKDEKISDQETKELNGTKILLVEDGPFNVMIAKKILENWNAVVEVAENGQIAVDKCSLGEYDIILMDLQMPVMDGISATKIIRAFKPHVPIIALTASASIEVQQDVMNSGMDDYISKPFNPESLYRTISKHVPSKKG